MYSTPINVRRQSVLDGAGSQSGRQILANVEYLIQTRGSKSLLDRGARTDENQGAVSLLSLAVGRDKETDYGAVRGFEKLEVHDDSARSRFQKVNDGIKHNGGISHGPDRVELQDIRVFKAPER